MKKTEQEKKDLWLALNYHIARLKQIRDWEKATLIVIDYLKEKLELERD
jgi:hypothetical protein